MNRHDLLSDANFQTWFGTSKMVDRQTGAPLIFYHKSRSKEKFTEFRHIGVEKNPYNKDYGFFFTEPMDKNAVQQLGDGIEIYCYLRMKRPFYIQDNGSGLIFDMQGVQHKPLYINIELIERAKRASCDGIIISCPKHYTQYIVWEPSQIKHMENNGSFSLNTNNMYE